MQSTTNPPQQTSPRSEISQISSSRAKSAAPSDLLNSSGRANSLSYENLSRTGDLTKNESYFSDADTTDSFGGSLDGSVLSDEEQDRGDEGDLEQDQSNRVMSSPQVRSRNASKPRVNRDTITTFTSNINTAENPTQISNSNDDMQVPRSTLEITHDPEIDADRELEIELEIPAIPKKSKNPYKGNVLSKPPMSLIHRHRTSIDSTFFSDASNSMDEISIFSDMDSSEVEFYDSEDDMLSCLLWELPMSDDTDEEDSIY